MPNSTDNHGYQLFSDGEESWEHRSDFNALEIDVEVRDIKDSIGNYTPHDGAKFLATDTGDIYIGDGDSWGAPVLTIGGGDGSNYTSVEGIDDARQHVGPLHHGDYINGANGLWGFNFTADPDLPIYSTVIDFNGASSTVNDVNIELYEAQTTNTGDANQEQSVVPDGMTESEALVDSVTTTLTDGPQRVTLDFRTPSSPETGEFFLGVGRNAPDETIDMRRVSNWGEFDEHTYDQISLQYGGRWNNTTNSDYTSYYYYAFDLEIGDPTTRVTSPWSTDVDEIYMRPRDPLEEFDDVSPRALWIDTSQ